MDYFFKKKLGRWLYVYVLGWWWWGVWVGVGVIYMCVHVQCYQWGFKQSISVWRALFGLPFFVFPSNDLKYIFLCEVWCFAVFILPPKQLPHGDDKVVLNFHVRLWLVLSRCNPTEKELRCLEMREPSFFMARVQWVWFLLISLSKPTQLKNEREFKQTCTSFSHD